VGLVELNGIYHLLFARIKSIIRNLVSCIKSVQSVDKIMGRPQEGKIT
jgi:hypothetical protein